MKLNHAVRIVKHEVKYVEYDGPESIEEIISLFGWAHQDDPDGGPAPIKHSGDNLWFIIDPDYTITYLEKGMIIYSDAEEGQGAMSKKDFDKFLNKHKYTPDAE